MIMEREPDDEDCVRNWKRNLRKEISYIRFLSDLLTTLKQLILIGFIYSKQYIRMGGTHKNYTIKQCT